MKKGLHISGMSMASSAAAGITIKGASCRGPLFFFFLLYLLLLSLAWLGRLSLHHHGLPCSKAGAVHPVIHRLLKPLSPDDCPACRLPSTPSSGAGPAPVPVRPWCEVKNRRGARHSSEDRGLCLSQPKVPLLWHYRCSHPRGFLAMASTARPNASRPFVVRPVTAPSARDATPRCIA